MSHMLDYFGTSAENSRRERLNLREFMAMSNRDLLVEISQGGVNAEAARWEMETRKMDRVHRLNLRIALFSALAGFALGLTSSLITAYVIQKAAAPIANASQNQPHEKK